MDAGNIYDLCVIGGGINGAGIARDAAMRGLRVLLLEQGDLASATSSASTKLVHGGLRYLENYEFSLVRESLREREVLLGIAPHIIWPLDFVLPHTNAVRPLWMIRAGLFLYDRLGGRKKMKSSRFVALRSHAYGQPLRTEYDKGFSYADCWVQDARLVVLNAMDARDYGADILTHHQVIGVEPEIFSGAEGVEDEDIWRLSVKNAAGAFLQFSARVVVNAAGPWAEKFLHEQGMYAHDPDTPHMRLVKGSHIIVAKIFEGAQAYILQQKDKRIVFAIPYEGAYTLIGTTDVAVGADEQRSQISPEEIAYLCAAVNGFFTRRIAPADVVATYSGVRALLDDGQGEARTVTRDYLLYHHKNCAAPFISIFGGKITTYRRLSEQVVDRVMAMLRKDGVCPTGGVALPGGDIAHGDVAAFFDDMTARYPWVPEKMLRRYCVHYGTRLMDILAGAASLDDLGLHCGGDVYAAELEYLRRHEFAQNAQDVLWRRTKLALHLDEAAQAKVRAFMEGGGHG